MLLFIIKFKFVKPISENVLYTQQFVTPELENFYLFNLIYSLYS